MTALQGRHLVITGAAGGVGAETARTAQAMGARVTLVDRVASNDLIADWLMVDLADRRSTLKSLEGLSRVDALLHVVGGFSMGTPVHEIDEQSLGEMLRLNVFTLQNALAAIVPGMVERRSGSIVTVGALGATRGGPQTGAYAVAKSAVMRLTESLSAELIDCGINVNCVLPSIIDTPRNRSDMPDADFTRWVTPQQVANVLCFLGSGLSSGMHGALVPVAGRVL